jgi:hypothetical protein
VAPDLYVLPGVAPGTRVRTWKKVWETGIVPSFALEVVSSDVDKDYVEAPRDYADLGVHELVIYDPDAGRAPDRVRWQVYRRVARRGLVRVEADAGDRVRSRVLGCWLRVVGTGEDARLRVATGPQGDVLFPTRAEAAEARRKTAEHARDVAEHARVAEQARRVAAERDRDAARVELARVQAELARLRGA